MAELNQTQINDWWSSEILLNVNETFNQTWSLPSSSVVLDLGHHGVRIHHEGPVGPLEIATALASLLGLLLISKILQKYFHRSRNQ